MQATVPTQCPLCKKQTEIQVDLAGFTAWQTGTLIQDALPDLTIEEREMLMTGIDGCWDDIFPDEAEETEE